MQTLARQRQQANGQIDAHWFVHMAGCLENQEKYEEAFTLAQAGLVAAGQNSATLRLHMAAILNLAGQHIPALQFLQGHNKSAAALPATRGERLRAQFARQRWPEALRESQAMLKAGHEIRWTHYIQGLCYENLNLPAKALKSFETAEQRDWPEPDINRAKARCLLALNRPAEAEAEQAKAARKQRYLGQ